jgi:hypothetical protein
MHRRQRDQEYQEGDGLGARIPAVYGARPPAPAVQNDVVLLRAPLPRQQPSAKHAGAID